MSFNKLKNKQIPHCRNSSNIKIVGRGKIDTPNTQMHDPSHSWFGTYNKQWY